jgi:hypothetical protein
MNHPSSVASDLGAFGTGPSSPAEQAITRSALDAGDLPVHLAVTTVLMKCPHPLSAIEVAVVLETCGYSPSRVRATGAADLMELARAVYALVPVYAQERASAADDSGAGPIAQQDNVGLALEAARSFCKGLLFSAPLLVSLSTMLVAGVSFWSSKVELRSIASSVTMAACLSLIFTGPFIQAFGRRASFYLGLGDNGMLAYLTKRVLGTGMLVAFSACAAAYFIRTGLSAGGPPAANRLGLATGLAIAALQLGLAPFYLRNAIIPMTVIVGGAGAVLAWHATHLGAYIDPVNLAVWQVRLVASMAALTWIVDGWWLLRSPEARHRSGADRRLWKPSGAAVARAVAPYGAFGLAYFCLVSLPQLVSGGAWLGRYGFNPEFSLASGMALVGLLPVAGFGAVAADRITRHVLPATLDHERIGSVGRARVVLRRHWRAQLLWAAVAAAGAAATVDVVLPVVAHSWLVSHGMAAHPELLYACSAGFFFFSIATFASQLLFGLSSPGRAVASVLAGTAVLLVCSGALSLSGATSLAVAAAAGFAAGSAVFAVLAVAAGDRAFSDVDFTCYRAL